MKDKTVEAFSFLRSQVVSLSGHAVGCLVLVFVSQVVLVISESFPFSNLGSHCQVAIVPRSVSFIGE